MQETVSIIGAGIGGLTTALVLKQHGIKVAIFEGADSIKPVGAGIILANNAMQVFKNLGLQDRIERAGNRISYMKITDAQLKNLSTIDLSEYERKYSVHNTAIHRGILQKILADEVGYENIYLSKKLSKIEKTNLFKLTFEDGSTVESKVVIGADGIKSVVRRELFQENTIRDTEQICWRGICDMKLPTHYHNELNEAWGREKRFGFVKISNKKVYWYALANKKNVDIPSEYLFKNFLEFHTDIQKIISSTSKDQIITGNVIDLKRIKTWQNENICLIGDAAHATTPNLGQGACQAIEDAYVLGKLLNEGFSITNAFKAYEQLRRQKAHYIVNRSWIVGKIAHTKNPLAVWIRNFIMRNMPSLLQQNQMDKIFKLN
ncbi:2-polyprenyl-6-methoxyphenol hydroxylase [Sphingobacterium nematocida]|uniref:2-polyprenyl-6-methoxyphenol hydroxylase n=1 Tax=Sphingobacterium nematocida TaxID=1513896 RepID=A0A1T5GQB0_9SPHI|nr:FAD-dependent monooxygenase [Sphingobacterium nematocida]SKC10561.1 2-polyprenyl-6-methoxyphenol hydroxylase [Sphingobacterium nematocida]